MTTKHVSQSNRSFFQKRHTFFTSWEFVGMFILFFNISLFAQNPVNEFTNNTLHKNATISIQVKDLKTNKIIHSHRAGNAAIPASTMKLVTTATALELFGADYQFKTTLEIDGKITVDSILNGNLIIYGRSSAYNFCVVRCSEPR